MLRFRNIILFVVLCAVGMAVWPVRADDSILKHKDSLYAILSTLEGDAKLQILWSIAKAERDAKAGKEIEGEAIDRFLQEARMQRDKKMEGEALMMLLVHSPFLHTCHMPSPSHSSQFYHPQNIG
jgi:hypothetical protein